tara:strand:- start:22640 stop:23632 length:993 start_codon:yes stop_codon:yes gene_type:complete
MKTKILTTLMAAVIIGMVAIPQAQAEESVVQVPFISHGQSCTFDELAIEYQCTWQGVRDVFTIEDLKEFKSVLSEQRYNQELQRLNEEALAEIAIEQAKLSPNELKIQQIEDKLDRGIATATDSVLMNLLKELSTCRQGMDERTQHIQTAREFEISDFQLWSVNNVKYEGKLGEIVRAIEECKSQKFVYEASVGYQNFVFGGKQYSLADKFTSEIQAIPYDKWTATNDDINKSLICDSNAHNQQYKKQFGCVILYDGLDTEEIKRQNEIRFGTNGVIEYKSEKLDTYYKFLETYGNLKASAVDKEAQAAISEPIANAWKENHNFYQNSLD